ncbi:hypothetical protein CANINC_003535 [Pichia inconspicua]|uniref:Bis(5'-adenosyl)-triphosphatase n=1 Tax=Pichia inconspicua TaxID=52247 RepID=A0A4T0WYF4_9ASCO|nr:hypothetical protein CANINC_003535 [[Candida] inconspicua]
MSLKFYKFPVNKQVFHISKYTFAIVNLKPIVAGHVLVIPFRRVAKLAELPDVESVDFFRTVQRVEKFVTHLYFADGLNLGIQDGLAAGQSIPHVHCHIIPRYLKDGWGDGVYEALESSEGLLQNEWWKRVCKPLGETADEERRVRTMEEMEREASWLKKEMMEWLQNNGEWLPEYDVDSNVDKIVQE